MNWTILSALAAGAVGGVVASMLPSKTLSFGFLCLIPLTMLVLVQIELSNPARRPDALDALLYFFGPLWPCLGAAAGFLVGRWVRGLVS